MTLLFMCASRFLTRKRWAFHLSGLAGGRPSAYPPGMTAERWRRAKALFEQALRVDAAARGALLASSGEDEEVRKTVERLLAAHEGAADFLETSPVRGLAANGRGLEK